MNRMTPATLMALLISAGLLISCTASEAPTPAPTIPRATEAIGTLPPSATPAAPTPDLSPAASPEDLAARVNGQPIPREAYQKQVAQFQAALKAQGVDPESADGQERMRQIREQVLQAMIEQVLIEQAAAAQGLSVPQDEVASRVEESISSGGGRERFEQWLADNNLTEAEYRESIRSQLLTEAVIEQVTTELPEAAPQVHLRQILVADEALAQQLHERLLRGESFDALARKYSEDESSRQQGGDIGWFPQGFSLLAPEVEEAAFSLKAGEISDVIRSSLGYYVIIQVIETAPSRPLSLEMQQSMRQQMFLNWLAQKRQEANIERYVGTE